MEFWNRSSRGNVASDTTIDPVDSFSEGDLSPIQHRLLNFQDPVLENAYLRDEHRRHRKYYLACTSVAALLVASFFWADPWLFPPNILHAIETVRAYVLFPSCLLVLAVTVWIAEPLVWIWATSGLVALFGLAHSALLLFLGSDAISYLEPAILECTLIVFLLYGLPFRWSVWINALYGVSFGVAIYHVATNPAPLVNFSVDYAAYAFFCAAAAYRYENASRREFIAQLRSRKEYSVRLAADAERRRWLEVIPAFLRHELKNSMTAIKSSIDMASRMWPHTDARKYLDRGQRSVQYTQRLLIQVADATNLEAALAGREFEPLDLSALIANRIEDLRAEKSGSTIKVDVEPNIHVLGDADSLLQMLDKLLNNAMEHGDAAVPIDIRVWELEGSCRMAVQDIGDPLPTDTEQIFEPFVTRKTRRGDGGNLGLGLFVARTIALSHGGDISAVALTDAIGARFVVQLPLLESGGSAGDPPIPTSALGPNQIKTRIEP